MGCSPCVTNNNSYLYIPPVFPLNTRIKIYSNTSLVFYKNNSLPSCSVGTVRNSRAVARRT